MTIDGARRDRTVCVTVPWRLRPADTFIHAHIDGLPANIVTVHGWRPHIGDRPVLPKHRLVYHKLRRVARRGVLAQEVTEAYLAAIRRFHIDAVLAEYGDHAIQAVEACRRAGVPLIAHFHGYDASVYSILEQNADAYRNLFARASAFIAVSRAMQRKLIEMGAPAERVHCNPYGVDCATFGGGDPAHAPPVILAVGRFVEKKAPHKTIAAFAMLKRSRPEAKLRMIGDGPLLDDCRRLARELQVESDIAFLGSQDSAVIRDEMRRARCFVQHSVVAASGDAEGTPVAVIEASATGIPIVATRHAGIPDVVIDGTTGLLVDEGDVAGMARHLTALIENPTLAGELGRAARLRAEEHFSLERRLAALWRVIEASIESSAAERRSVRTPHSVTDRPVAFNG
jgi:glycosyltransferase involved in cell wall biosynthesis